ncbi:MAG TPA: hypothetical protein VM820_03490 [Vicinamibacterales bacterium]|nr:hypothetical protein [Vicinamibacterales bacterium]
MRAAFALMTAVMILSGGGAFRWATRRSLEALYNWTRSRDTTGQDFATSDNIVNLRVKRVY